MTLPAALTLWALACGPAPVAYTVPGCSWSYQSTVDRAADAALIPRALAFKVAGVESGFRPRRVSPEGSRGLFQILARDQRYLTARFGVVGFRWARPADSALLGCLYLAELHRRFATWPRAVAAYNMGPTALAAGRKMPAETRDYVRRVFE